MKFTKKILKNGLRVITIPMKESPAVTVLVMVEAGSKYESKETNGISHFLEHMVFKGTAKRPHASLISKELDSLGADYNAYTGEEMTAYYAKVDKKHFDKALDIVSDMYLNPILPQEEIEKEKGVIVEEIRMYKDRPDRLVGWGLNELLYGDQPAGWTVVGPEENIRSFNRDTFAKYRKDHYVPSATIVVIAGAMKEAEAHKKVAKIFGSISSGSKKDKPRVKEMQTKPQVKVMYKDTDQTHLALALRTFNVYDKRVSAMHVLATVLGRGMSSRLFAKMRDELGICYYVHAYHQPQTDSGTFEIAAGVDTSRVELALQTILDELKCLAHEPVSKEELKKAKDYVAGTTMLGLETSDAQAEYFGRREVLKREIVTPEQMIARIQKVTAKDIQKLAQEFFVDKGLNMAIIGPYKDEHRFDKILTLKKVL